jgi:uncharacterized membrane protein YkvA (DUF1232 family)
MHTKQIRKLIVEAIAIEEKTHNLRNALDTVASMRGCRLTEQQRKEAIQFIQEYVEHAPALLDHIAEAARKAGIYQQISDILDAAEQYFLQSFDLMPDSLGLLGLMDDAYVAHKIIQDLSDRYQQQSGFTLVPSDMTNTNFVMRTLIGEPQASMLDNAIAVTLGQPLLQQALQAAINNGAFMNLQGPDPIWGNASIDEIVNTRMGVLGIF